MNALRLRVGVALILLWVLPFWLLATPIANSITPGDAQLVAEITTAIMIVQTLIGIIGFYIAGSQVKIILKNSKKREALRTIGRILITGKVEHQA
mgnify:CR=1 FL=1